MKNTFKLLGIIALAAVIGFLMVSCSDDDEDGGGGLTITGLDDYNGNYVVAYGNFEFGAKSLKGLIAADSIDFSNKDSSIWTQTGGKISGGSVTLKVYEVTIDFGDTATVTDYSGNDTVEFEVTIFKEAKNTLLHDGEIGYGTVKVTFKNGVASGKFLVGRQTVITITGFPVLDEGNYGYIILSETKSASDAVAYGAAAKKINGGSVTNEMVDEAGSAYGKNDALFIIIGVGATAEAAKANALARIGYVSDSKKAVMKGECMFDLNAFSPTSAP